MIARCISSVSYIKPQRARRHVRRRAGCISSVSYIKPQRLTAIAVVLIGCISSVSYIKPQPAAITVNLMNVVYRPFPTSNHNATRKAVQRCYVVYRPFPTSNHNRIFIIFSLDRLYIVRFLHQTTTYGWTFFLCRKLYIVRFLHQTTTASSNSLQSSMLYIVRFLHQTTTFCSKSMQGGMLYIVRFLHQTTTAVISPHGMISCISSVSYIKPQPLATDWLSAHRCISSVSYIKPQPIISNKLYTNILLIFFIIKNGRVGFVSIAKILKKLQLDRFADDFFCDFA